MRIHTANISDNFSENISERYAGDIAWQRSTTGDIMRQVLVVIATISTLIVNFLANALPINGLETGQISDRFDVYFVPAGYVFSIWGLIYLGLIGYTVFQALPSQRTNPLLRAIGPVYILSAVANISWIFLWHYEQFILTLPVMLILLGTLIVIYRRLDAPRQWSQIQRWLVRIPFCIYLGWITVATVANFTSTLDAVNWNGWEIDPLVWFAILLTVATLIGLAFAWLRREVAYVAVLVWAFAGIAVEHSGTNFVVVASLAAAALLVVAMAFAWWRGGSRTASMGA